MNKFNFRSVQIISLSVLILFSCIFTLFFELFYKDDSDISTETVQTTVHKKKKSNNVNDSETPLTEQTFTDNEYEYSFDSDAIIFLPGITGSELLSDGEYTVNDNVIVRKGDYVWLPTELLKFIEDFDITSMATDYLYYAAMSLEMLGMDENGDSVYSIVPKPVSEDDLYIGTLGTATEIYNRLYDEFSDKCDVIFYGYDWRYSCVDTAEALERFINDNGYESVTFVCHSMGGIVAAHYLDRSDDNIQKTAQVITIGTPYGGSAKALMALQNGRFIELGVLDPLIKRLSYNMQSIYELLPTEYMIDSLGGYIVDDGAILDAEGTREWYSNDFKCEKNGRDTSVNTFVYEKALEAQNMLINEGMHIMNDPRIDVCMIAGYDISTVSKVFESDDYISQIAVNYAGDGTVSIDSATKYNGEYFDNPIYFVRYAEHRLMLLNNNVIDLTVNAIYNGSEIDAKAIDEDILTTDDLTVKNDGDFEIKDVEDSLLGNAFGYIYEQFISKEQ